MTMTILIVGRKNMRQSKNKLIEMLEYVIADHSVEEKKNYLKNECGIELTKELEGKVEAMGESMGRVILQGMLEDAWDKGVEEERKKTEEQRRKTEEQRRKTEEQRRKTEEERENTKKERKHAIAVLISFGISKEKILERGSTEEEYTEVEKNL